MYHKSLAILFNHLVRANWYYQKGIQIISGGKYCNDIGEHSAMIQRIESSFSKAASCLQELDLLFREFISQVSEEDLGLNKKDFKLYTGRIADVSIWEIVTQHITHQIHHRGQISQVLDELKLEHDIGNIWPYVQDSLKK